MRQNWVAYEDNGLHVLDVDLSGPHETADKQESKSMANPGIAVPRLQDDKAPTVVVAAMGKDRLHEGAR